MSNLIVEGKLIENENIEILSTIPKDFIDNINKIQAFSKKLPNEIDLPTVPTSGGLFGLFDYSVTGANLNRLTDSIQNKMIEQNKVLVSTIQEFNTVYETFASLDKDFLQKFLISIKAVDEANEKALKGIGGVQINQSRIEQITDELKQIVDKQKQSINEQKQIIVVLKNFKEKIEKIEHLPDIDKIFESFSTIQDNFEAIEARVEQQEHIATDLINDMKVALSSQLVFQDNLYDLKENQNFQFQAIKQLITLQNEEILKFETISKEIKVSIQTLSEKIVYDNFEFNAKLEATITAVTENKVNIENSIEEINIEIEKKVERITTYFQSELLNSKSEINDLRLLIEKQSKVLKLNKVISFTSIGALCILVILMVSGVL